MKYGGFFSLLIVGLLTVSVISNLVPTNIMKKNLQQATEVLEKEGEYPKGPLNSRSTTLDNFTDALIINVVDSGETTKNLLERTVGNYYYQEGGDSMVFNLVKKSEQDKSGSWVSYSRYWFGTAVCLRFLLPFLNYTEIRALLTVIIYGLTFLIILRLQRRLGGKVALVFGLTFLSMRGFMIGYSLQFAPITILTLGTTLMILRSFEKKVLQEKLNFLFLGTGILTAFFDLLTFPLISLGIPLVIVVLESLKKRNSTKQITKGLLQETLAWGGGYFGTFLVKFLLSALVLGCEAWSTATAQVAHRVGGQLLDMWQALLRNGGTMFGIWTALIIALLVLIWAIYAWKCGIIQEYWRVLLIFLAIAIMPYVWYIVFSNHSMVHFWFTYRAQAVSVFAILVGTLYYIGEGRSRIYNEHSESTQSQE